MNTIKIDEILRAKLNSYWIFVLITRGTLFYRLNLMICMEEEAEYIVAQLNIKVHTEKFN